MSSTDINYKKFLEYIHHDFENKISFEEIEKILDLEEDYNKDSPSSLGKSLVLKRLIFSGEKVSKEKINFDQSFHKGINVWIGHNGRGKSTIFKIIKFALSGTDSIKADISPWIKDILLEFKINENTYTCHIDRTGRDRGALYIFGIEKFLELRNNQKLDIIDKEKECDFNSNKLFQDKMQEFFFEQFSFYSLKYTTHNSSKENLELSTANLSWLTYFKSIYLESKNYEYLFFDNEDKGAQGKKIFEMLLGLHLTYPINMLSLQRDRVTEEIGKIKLINNSRTETTKEKKIEIENRLAEIANELLSMKNIGISSFDERSLIEEYGRIQAALNEARKQQRILRESLQFDNDKQAMLEVELNNLGNDQIKIENEIKKLKKQELNFSIYKDAESFFSNLDIKTCPHCETGVSESKKENERTNHVCALCGETSTKQKIEEAELVEKTTRINEEIEKHTLKSQQVNKSIEQKRKDLDKFRMSIQKLYEKINNSEPIEKENERLKEIEIKIESINNERKNQKELIEKKEVLSKNEAVLRFQLGEIEKEKSITRLDELNSLNLKKNILEKAIEALEKKRIYLNKDIIDKLEKLIQNEVHAFGLKNIEQVKISEKYELILKQNEVLISFNDLNEGEKLRVKLAFYLSLIQLDIEHNLGRHPRFLIFDSPGSEEMSEDNLHGLSDILKEVNKRFANNLQIFVGSALREFAGITEAKKTVIKEKTEFFF